MSATHCSLVVSVPVESSEARFNEPVTIGVPLPRAWSAGDDLKLTAPDGPAPPFGIRVLDRWNDGSARWILVDFLATSRAGSPTTYGLERGDGAAHVQISRIAVTESPDVLTVDTGALLFTMGRRGNRLLRDVRVYGRSILDADRSGFALETDAGTRHRPDIERVDVTHHGAVRVAIRVHATIGPAADPLLRLDGEFEFFAGSPVVRCTITVHNPQPATHPGGIWELGTGGQVLLRDFSFELSTPENSGGTGVRCSAERGASMESFEGPFVLYQDSSGGANWQSSNHVNRDGVVPLRFRGYTLSGGNTTRTGLRATPVVSLDDAGTTIAITMEHFWQNFPKAVEAESGTLRLRLFPGQFTDLHEIQGGEQKTHVFYLSFGRDSVTQTPLEWARAPLFVRCTPEWYCGSGVVPFLVPATDDPHQGLVAYQCSAIEGPNTFEAKREVIDEYGWRNFGDIYADHEAVSHQGDTPLISHYNNQYDAAAGMAWQFFRTGDERWWRAFLELTSHVRDIDIYHTTGDKAAYNGGMFWHTYHYLDAGKCSHRSYPKAPGVAGGGPSNEHDYSGGLLLRYFLTGHAMFREAVIDMGNWVINMDDGRQSVLRWITSARTGHASSTGDPLYHGPGRGSAYSIQTLLNAHQLTSDDRYLVKAEELLTRCIHPADDIEALNLLDAERRWFYTVFLQAIGTYLLYKERRGDLDRTYWYARSALLHYARWMADHEYPYLDKPEILEYPTETWAAMDMRKSEVFCHAARYTADGEQGRFLERARFFFSYSVNTLRESPTGHLARPMVVLLSNGVGLSWLETHGAAPPADARYSVADFGHRRPFTPQRVIAKQRLRLAAAAAGVTSVLLGWWLAGVL